MQTVLTLIARTLLAFIDTIATLLGALGVRWLFGYSTPEKDWRLLQEYWQHLRAYVSIPDPLAGVNLAYLARVRERYASGWYTQDDIITAVPDVVRAVIETDPYDPEVVRDESTTASEPAESTAETDNRRTAGDAP